jgi:hypothetical protein
MIDFSPLEGALMDGCALLVGRVVRGSSAFGSADELRVNMEAPKELLAKSALTCCRRSPHQCVAGEARKNGIRRLGAPPNYL